MTEATHMTPSVMSFLAPRSRYTFSMTSNPLPSGSMSQSRGNKSRCSGRMALCLENDLRECLSLCMRDAQRDMLHSELLGNFSRLAPQCQRRPPVGLPHHLQIDPADPASPACS